MNLALELAIDLAKLVAHLLARANLEHTVVRNSQMNLALIEAAQIELVDDTRLVGVVQRIARYEFGRQRLIEIRLTRASRVIRRTRR